jgi:hypothetical protein
MKRMPSTIIGEICIRFQRSDVVLVPFPFSDLSTTKVRPAVVVSSALYHAIESDLIRLESDEFREHVVSKHKDYGPLLSFIQPPEVRVAVRRAKSLTYESDVSESVSLNKDGAIANVQWDFDHQAGKFISTQGYTFLRDKKTKRAVLVVEYTFPQAGTYTVACSVQDGQGGERTVVQVVEVM